ncbi:hypothetical protein [Halorientalis salina]|uniref:hypothetical protein n=1 Tax=Halorientalis salina TaxID=2932266 RepID=UPI0010AD0E20|nr:hypothetical protein [Halorientalis salina]
MGVRSALTRILNYVTGRSSGDKIDPQQYRIVPPRVEEKGPDWGKRGNYYRRAFAITDLPPTIEPLWFSRISKLAPSQCSFLSPHLTPITDFSRQSKQMNRLSQLQSRRHQQRRQHQRGQHETDSLLKTTHRLFHTTFEDVFFELGIYIDIRAESKDELEQITERLYDIASEEDIPIVPIRFRRLESMLTNSPIVWDEIEYHMIVDADTFAGVSLALGLVPPGPTKASEDSS